MATDDMFQLDTEGDGEAMSSESASDLAGSGAVTPKSRTKSEVALCRKALPVIQVEKDVCSICLDEFDPDNDPGIPTHCGHYYHLQCIMEWAMRSRECPMCFHTLELKDPDLHAMLPFGEYVSPQQAAAATASLESWDLERLLAQLAAANQRHARRAAREAARQQRRRGEPSTPQPIVRQSSSGGGDGERHLPEESVPSGPPALGHTSSSRGAAGQEPRAPAATFPASWPPTGSRAALGTGRSSGEAAGSSSGSSSSRPSGPGLSPSLKAASQSIKSRFASLKIRESFSKTTKEIKAIFSPSHRTDRPAAGT